jgi:Family of unknown function (DUF5362)
MDYTTNTNLLEESNLNQESKVHLSGIAQWTNILCIISFVSLGVSVISLFTSYFKLKQFGDFATGAAMGSGIFGLLITTAITLLIYITLFNASKFIKLGINQNDQGYFNMGITKLATYFRILGIIAIVFGVIFFLAILVMIFAGFATNSFR